MGAGTASATDKSHVELRIQVAAEGEVRGLAIAAGLANADDDELTTAALQADTEVVAHWVVRVGVAPRDQHQASIFVDGVDTVAHKARSVEAID